MTGPWSPSTLLLSLLLVALGAGCTQKPHVEPEQLDRRALAEDSRVMAQRYSHWQRSRSHPQALPTGPNEQMPLDLADPAQFRFVENRLRAAGLTPVNAPRLFARLLELQAKARARQRPLAGGVTAAAVKEPPELWCGHLVALGGAGSDDVRTRFEGTALASCFGGSDYGFVDLSAYATDEAQTTFELLAAESYEEYGGKVLETPRVEVSLERSSGRQLLVDSVALAFNEVTGEDYFTYTSVQATASSGAGTFVLEHPTDLLDLRDWDKAIRLCLERGAVHGSLDCDYGAVRLNPDGTWEVFPAAGATGIVAVNVALTLASGSGGGPTTWIPDWTAYWESAVQPFNPGRFQVPVRGRVMPYMNMDECTVEQVTSKVVAILTESGGWCQAGTSPGTVVAKGQLPFIPSNMPGVYPFDGIIDFGKDNCLDNAQGVRLQFWAFVEGTCNVGGDSEPFRCPIKTEVDHVDYTRVCLAEGTQVVRADGKKVPVETVGVGDKLLANGSGLALTVTTVSRGGEGKPLVKLRDTAGGEVMMTETHPLVTATRGVVQAGELKVGESVHTRDGVRKLAAVERVPYDGLVYNLAVGTKEELAQVGHEARTLYANGFLVGDSEMQRELEKARRVDTREVLARVHGAWHEDYRHFLAGRGSARR